MALDPPGPYRALKQFGLVLLCAAWIVLGLVGHDPWKTEDATTFGVALDMIAARRLRRAAARRRAYRRPHRRSCYVAGGASRGSCSRRRWPLHDAARIAAGALPRLTHPAARARLRRELYGRAFRWLPVLILDRLGRLLGPRARALARARPDCSASRSRSTASRSRCAGRSPAALCSGWAPPSHSFARDCRVPLWLALTALVLPALRRSVAHAAVRRHAADCGLVVAVAAVRAVAARALPAATPRCLARGCATEAPRAITSRSLGDAGSADPVYYAEEPAVVRVAGAAAASLWTLWTRGRGFNGGLAQPGRADSRRARARDPACACSSMPDPQADRRCCRCWCRCALLASLEIDTLKRGFSGALDWFGILTFGLLAIARLGALVRRVRSTACRRPSRASSATPKPATSRRSTWAPSSSALFLTLLWLALVRPARRSQSPRGAQLGGRHDAAVGARTRRSGCRTSIRAAAIASMAEALRDAPAARRLRREPQPGRAAARAASLFREPRDGARGDAPIDATATRCSCSTAASTATPAALDGWQSVWEGQRRGDDTERFVLYVRKAAREIHRRSD